MNRSILFFNLKNNILCANFYKDIKKKYYCQNLTFLLFIKNNFIKNIFDKYFYHN